MQCINKKNVLKVISWRIIEYISYGFKKENKKKNSRAIQIQTLVYK